MRRVASGINAQREAQKKKVGVLVVLLGTLAVIGLVSFLKGRPGQAVAKPASASGPAATKKPTAVAADDQEPRIEVQVEWPAVLERDLFGFDQQGYGQKKIKKTVRVGPVFKLQGTLLGDDPRALINGKRVRIGQSIEGAVVKMISHGYVILELDGIAIRIGKKGTKSNGED